MNISQLAERFCRPPPKAMAGLVLLAWCLVLAAGMPVAAGDAGPVLVHFAFSKSIFTDLNENDTRAAMKVYTKTIGDENGIDTGTGPVFLDGTNAIASALRRGQFDLISLTAEDFFKLENQGLEGPLLLSRVNRAYTEEYVLLARADSNILKVEDLKGRRLIILSDVRGSLVPVWLGVLCRSRGLGPPDQFLGRMVLVSKVTQVVLPVFFGKADACVVTRNGWEIMGELNPQVKKQLRAIAMSPPVVPAVSCFRRGVPEATKERVFAAAEGSFTKPSFKQLMALFKTDDLGHQPIALLDGTRQLMANYHALCASPNPAGLPATNISPGLEAGEGK